jgi:hypothetical protein
MVRKTRKIKQSRKKGGSYRTPMDPIENFNIRIMNAHGSISPEYYYIVPENVYLLLPNTCGVSASADDVAAQSLFQTPEEGIKTFLNRFVKGGSKAAGTPFTVYEPGDIIPMHVLSFDPRFAITQYFLRREVPNYNFGFVGIFRPGSLEKLPFLNDALVDEGPKINLFQLIWKDFNSRKSENANYSTESWVIQRYCKTLLNYLKRMGDIYTEYLRPYEDIDVGTMTREQCDNIIRFLLPVIPESYMAYRILASKIYTYSMYDIITEVVSKRANDHPLFVVMNTCRSLQERGSKPSMAIVRAISNASHTNSDPAAVNMNTINNFRKAKGLSLHKHAVLKYDQLRTFLRETKESHNPLTDTEFNPVISRIESLLAVLSDYIPPAEDIVSATIYMNNNIARIHGEIEESLRIVAAEAEGVKKDRDLLLLKRRRDKLKDDIAVLKRGKGNATALKAELSSILEQIREIS